MATRVFMVGAESIDSCQKKKFCNGPLEPNTKYRVKLRGFTESGDFNETLFSEAIRTGEARCGDKLRQGC